MNSWLKEPARVNDFCRIYEYAHRRLAYMGAHGFNQTNDLCLPFPKKIKTAILAVPSINVG